MKLSRGYSWSKGGLGSSRRAALRAALQGVARKVPSRRPTPASPCRVPAPPELPPEGAAPGWLSTITARPFLLGLGLLVGIATVTLVILSLWRPQVVVVAPAGLPAFTVVRESDLAVQYRRPSRGSFQTVSDAVGRWVSRGTRSGEVLQEGHLGPALGTGESARRVVSLPMPAPNQLGLRMGDEVSLLLVPRAADAQNDAPEVVIPGVLVLATTTSPAAVVFAIPEREVAALARHLAGSSVVVVR